MALFDAVCDEYHQCAMGNLYNSTVFFRAAYNKNFKLLCHGVTRKGGRGLPPSILQEALNSKKGHIEARGTTNAAVTQGDPEFPNIVASSDYDTKPVHYLIMVFSDLKWFVTEKDVFNVDMGRTETLHSLRMNKIHNYNFSMGSVDVSYQLIVTYRVDNWFRNRN